MKVLLIRRGQELEVAKKLLEAVEARVLSRAQNASAESEHISSVTLEEHKLFGERIARMREAHVQWMEEQDARIKTLDAQASELTNRAERVRDATALLD